MKPLIVIPSCFRDRYTRVPYQKKLLEGHDYKYFYGVGNIYNIFEHDTIILPVRDDWEALPDKCRAIFHWALDHDYDYVFKTDTDTYIHADRLMAATKEPDFETHDFIGLVGSMVTQNLPGDCCGGGAGYWLSRFAMITYLQAYGEFQVKTANWMRCEDWCLYTVLHRNSNIRPHHDPRYWDFRLGPIPDEATNITYNEWKP